MWVAYYERQHRIEPVERDRLAVLVQNTQVVTVGAFRRRVDVADKAKVNFVTHQLERREADDLGYVRVRACVILYDYLYPAQVYARRHPVQRFDQPH